MSDEEHYFSSRGLSQIPFEYYPNNFTFIVGDDRYSCPHFVADFLSAKVGRYHSDDPLLDHFSIHTADPNHVFGSLLDSARGSPLGLDPASIFFLADVVLDILEDPLTLENAAVRVETRTRFGHIPTREIEYVAAHFSELSDSFLNSLSIDFLTEVLIPPSLRLQSEDHLYDFLSAHADSDVRYFDLLEHVCFEYLTPACVSRAVSFIQARLGDLTPPVWLSLSRRLLAPQASISAFGDNRFGMRIIAYREGSPFDVVGGV